MDVGINNICQSITTKINDIINPIGLLFRSFSRAKDGGSLKEKMIRKGEGYYSKDGKKIQDIVGIRLVTYFCEDVNLLWDIMGGKFEVVGKEVDDPKENMFEVKRMNMVCRMPEKERQTFLECKAYNKDLDLVDDTFEIQFRTINSEGWHEIDHLLKYKKGCEWGQTFSRMFNGIYATLETCDLALKSLFDDISYDSYLKKDWESMMRMKYKLHFEDLHIREDVNKYLMNNANFTKCLFQFDRSILIKQFVSCKIKIPITFDNIIFAVNRLGDKDQNLMDLEPINIHQDLEKL